MRTLAASPAVSRPGDFLFRWRSCYFKKNTSVLALAPDA